MRSILKLWRSILIEPLGRFRVWRERNLIKQSAISPIVVGHQRDALRVFDRGRSVTVEAVLGSKDPERTLLIGKTLNWDEDGTALSDEEAERIINIVIGWLTERRITWRMIREPAQAN